MAFPLRWKDIAMPRDESQVRDNRPNFDASCRVRWKARRSLPQSAHLLQCSHANQTHRPMRHAKLLGESPQRDRAGRTNESAPKAGALPIFTRSEPQAATLPGLTSRSLLEFAIGIDRGFIASGISRTRSTCRSPFSRLAPLTLT